MARDAVARSASMKWAWPLAALLQIGTAAARQDPPANPPAAASPDQAVPPGQSAVDANPAGTGCCLAVNGAMVDIEIGEPISSKRHKRGDKFALRLAEPLVVDEATLANAARVVAARDDRVLISKGDRAYARGAGPTALLMDAGKPRDFRIFRNSTPLKDPVTGEVLGFEGQYVGQAVLARPETTRDVTESSGTVTSTIVPATIDVVSTKEEIRVGDRLLPEPERQMRSYTPHAPAQPVDARVVSIYGDGLSAGQYHVVSINRGRRDGIEPGHVLALLRAGERVVDREDPLRPTLKLPDEPHGQLFVFRVFERVSYGLILSAQTAVRPGDRCTPP